MNYKNMFKKTGVRKAVIKLLSLLPDKAMLKLFYRVRMGEKLNLKRPRTFNEKLQWSKLYYRNPLLIKCSNKYTVREYVASCGLEDILNENYGVFDEFEDIDFSKLPNEFVLKDTVGGYGERVWLCEDKQSLDIEAVKEKINTWLHSSIGKNFAREWSFYSQPKRQVIVEKLLKSNAEGDLPDYKFFCFDGEVKYLYFMRNYTKDSTKGECAFLNRDFELIGVTREEYIPIEIQPEKPKNYERMLEIAEILSKGFPHVRVDLYNIDGKIVFGEMTFFTCDGYAKFTPRDFDKTLGDCFTLTKYEP